MSIFRKKPKPTPKPTMPKDVKKAWLAFSRRISALGWDEDHVEAIRELGLEPHALGEFYAPDPVTHKCRWCGVDLREAAEWNVSCPAMPYIRREVSRAVTARNARHCLAIEALATDLCNQRVDRQLRKEDRESRAAERRYLSGE